MFTKYLSVSMIIVFLSFLVLGIVLMVILSNYWTNMQISDLEAKTESLAKYAVSQYRVSTNAKGEITLLDVENHEVFQGTLDNTSAINNIDIIILDPEGNVHTFSNPETHKYHLGSKVGPNIAAIAAETGKYSARGNLDGFYEKDHFVVAMPLMLRQSETTVGKYASDYKVGVIIVTSDDPIFTNLAEMVLRWFILSSVVALLLSILAISVASYNMVKPLKQMAEAVKAFGKGDFSVRIKETTNDEIGELAVSFNNMAESLSSSENTRRSFVANVSHELKTPMTTISGFIDGILDGTIPPEKHTYYLDIVSAEIKRLSRLVHSMLNLSRIDNGELKINNQTFDIFNTLVTIVITFEYEIERKNIDIRGLDNIKSTLVYGDKDLLHQVIYNLIENAVKFTDDGGYIEFGITETASRVNFRIKNSGQGIKNSELPLIFERFYKTDKSRSKDKKGLGLGLYLVRSIIRKHGGDISAQSEYGNYTEFEFYIPKKTEKKSP